MRRLTISVLLAALFGFTPAAFAATWEVQPGDSLYAIARAHGVSLDALRAANPGRSDAIHPGDELALPEGAAVTVEAGESLAGIARRYDVDLRAFLDVNELPSTMVNPGTVLELPQASAAQPAVKTHIVTPGDTLYGLALEYGTTVDELLSINGLDGHVIRPGDELVVGELRTAAGEAAAEAAAQEDELVVVIEPGDTAWDLARVHDVPLATLLATNGLSERSILRPGDLVSIPGIAASQGQNVGGAAPREVRVRPGDTLSTLAVRHGTTVAALMSANNLTSDRIRVGDTLRVLRGADLGAAQAATTLNAAAGSLLWPARGKITSYFGYRTLRVNGSNFHSALDIDGITGDPILAAAGGVVTHSGWMGSYGKIVIVESHDGEREYRYAHASSLLVGVGETVQAGQLIARIGNTGLSYGSHLHFEVHVNGDAVDPLPLLAAR